MSRVLCLSLAVLLGLPFCARAEDWPLLLLSAQERYSSHLELAQERIEKKDWSTATSLLQKLLDLDSDVLVSVRRKAPDGKETTVVVSARSEVNRLFAAMPAEGQEFYQKEYGGKAAELVKQARKLNDRRLFVEAARRYLWTEAGIEAVTAILKQPRLSADPRFYTEVMHRFLNVKGDRYIHRLAAQELVGRLVDGGDLLTAAPCLDQLLDRIPSDYLSPETQFRASLVYRHTGNVERFEKAWKLLSTSMRGEARLEIGEKKLSLEDIKKEIEKQKPLKVVQSEQREWRMFRGDASRSARAAGGVPFLDPAWKFETSSEPQIKGWIKQAADHLDTLKQPLLHGFSPLAVTLTQGGAKIPLFLYRDSFGTHARTVKGVPTEQPPLKPGDLYWEHPAMWSMDRMVREPRHVGSLTSWIQTYLNKVRPGILFENSVYGSLSADSQRVYAVEDFQIPPYNPQKIGRLPPPPGGVAVGQGDNLRAAFEHNRLQAYDLDSGKLLWEVGEHNDKGELNDSFFLSPPLPLNGKLHVLNEKAGELRLLTLKPETGAVLSVRSLARFSDRKMMDVVNRRIDAAHLAYADGIFVCPTNAGAVLGVEEKTGQMIWAIGYETSPSKSASRWRASAPLISRDKVVLAPSDGDTLACVNLRDGRLLWQHPREKDDLYVGGIIEDVVIVVSNRSCRGLKLADGKEAWKVETGTPSGLGVAAGKVFYLPLAESSRTRQPGITVIDPVKGIVVSHVRSRKQEVPGNLCFAGDVLISQNLTHIVAYPLVQAEINAVDKLLKKNPNDPAGLARRGDLKLDQGELKSAIDDFRIALQNKPDDALHARLRERLHEALDDLVQRDFAAAEPYLKDFEALSREPPRRTRYLILVARGREKQGKRLEAARLYLNLAERGADEMIEVPGDPDRKESAAVFARKQIEALLKAASPEERKQIDKEVNERLFKAGSK